MNKKLKMILIPTDIDINKSELKKYTGPMSDDSKLILSKIGDTVYMKYNRTSDLKLDFVKFEKSLSNTLKKQMPNDIFDLQIITSDDDGKEIDITPKDLIRLFENTENINVNIEEDDYEYTDYDDIDDDTDDVEEDDYNQFGIYGIETENIRPRKNKTKDRVIYKQNKTYKVSSSKVLNGIKRWKKQIKCHGILIKSGHQRKKDAKTIYRFIKKFIPITSNMNRHEKRVIEKYRKLILRRWLNSYCITKKRAKKISNDYLANSDNDKSITSSVTSRISKYNPFYDINK